jgi:hypothetical protein
MKINIKVEREWLFKPATKIQEFGGRKNCQQKSRTIADYFEEEQPLLNTCSTFSVTLATIALNFCALRWFEISPSL